MRTAKTNNQPCGSFIYLMVGVLAVAFLTPVSVEGASVGAGNPADAELVAWQSSSTPSVSSGPDSMELQALRTEVQRLQLLVAQLQHALTQLHQPEFDPATLPAVLEPLAPLQDLFPDSAHDLCQVVDRLGPAYLPGFCLDHP